MDIFAFFSLQKSVILRSTERGRFDTGQKYHLNISTGTYVPDINKLQRLLLMCSDLKQKTCKNVIRLYIYMYSPI